MRSAVSHRCELVLVPQRADNESHQTTLLKPAQRQLWTEGEEVTHLVQVERTLAGHRDEGCEEEEKTQVLLWCFINTIRDR